MVRIKKHREFEGLIKSVTISMTTSGKYYVSVLVEQEEIKILPKSDNNVGIDLGLKNLLLLLMVNVLRILNISRNLKID